MQKDDFIADLLEAVFADECDIVGPTNVRDIASNSVEFVDTQHGLNMDLGSILTLLAAGAVIANNAISAYLALRRQAVVPITPETLRDLLSQSSAPPADLEQAKLDEIYSYVCRRMADDAAASALEQLVKD